jgi:hypothetical protein
MSWYKTLPQRSVELFIDASPADVGALVSDLTFPVGKSRELDEAAWGEHPTGEPGVGSTIIGNNLIRGWGEWTTTSWVTEWEPDRRFKWVVHDLENPISSWVFELEAVDGSTKLTQEVTLGPGRSAIPKQIHHNPKDEAEIVEKRLTWQARNMLANLEAAKAALEG